MPGVLCIGTLVIDIINDPIDRILDPGEGVPTRIGIHPGGCSYNVAVDIVKLAPEEIRQEITVGCVGAVGDDILAEALRSGAETHGVIPMFQRFPGVGTSKNVILNIRGEERRHHYDAGANPLLEPEFVTRAIESFEPDLVYLGEISSLGRVGGEVAGIVAAAKESGCLIALDAVVAGTSEWGTLGRACRYADVLHCNDVEAMAFTDTSSVADALAGLAGRGVRFPVVSSGGGLICWIHGSRRYAAPAYTVAAVDATGAGDALVSGLIVSALSHAGDDTWPKDADEALEAILFAEAAGAGAVTRIGCTAGVGRDDVARLLSEQGDRIRNRVIGAAQ